MQILRQHLSKYYTVRYILEYNIYDNIAQFQVLIIFIEAS